MLEPISSVQATTSPMDTFSCPAASLDVAAEPRWSSSLLVFPTRNLAKTAEASVSRFRWRLLLFLIQVAD